MQVPGSYGNYVNMQSAAVATGEGTSLGCADVAGMGFFNFATFQVTGITTVTITWEATLDNTNWVAILVKNLNTGAEATTTTANGLFRVQCTGLLNIRARISSWSTGATTVTGIATA